MSFSLTLSLRGHLLFTTKIGELEMTSNYSNDIVPVNRTMVYSHRALMEVEIWPEVELGPEAELGQEVELGP